MVHTVEELHKLGQYALGKLIAVLPLVAIGVVVWIAFIILAIILYWVVLNAAKRSKNHRYLYQLLARIVKIAVCIVGLICALGTMGINVTALVTSFGLAGFAVSFATKDMLSNTLAGIMLLLHQPFRIGDHISVQSVEGQVVEVNLRYTTLHCEGSLMMIPNSMAFTNIVKVEGQKKPLGGE